MRQNQLLYYISKSELKRIIKKQNDCNLGVKVNFRSDKLGYGHFTYKQGVF